MPPWQYNLGYVLWLMQRKELDLLSDYETHRKSLKIKNEFKIQSRFLPSLQKFVNILFVALFAIFGTAERKEKHSLSTWALVQTKSKLKSWVGKKKKYLKRHSSFFALCLNKWLKFSSSKIVFWETDVLTRVYKIRLFVGKGVTFVLVYFSNFYIFQSIQVFFLFYTGKIVQGF